MATVVIPNAINVDKLHQDIKSIPTKPTLKSINGADYAKLKKQQNQVIQKVSKAHIESFDFMLDEGLPKGVKHIKPLHMELPNGKRLKVWINDVTVGEPRTVKDSNARNAVVYPSECRIRGTSYMAKLHVTFSYSIDGKGVDRLDEIVGDIPIMLKSRRCNLRNMTPTQLVNKYEDAEEIGGYFIVNGNERVVRFLTAQRRNYPMALVRKSWADSGQLFTEYGVQLRSVRPDQIGTSMILHYLSNGTTRLKIWYQKMPIFLPIVMVLKALKDCSDEYIYREMVKGKEDDTFYCSCAINMVRLVQQEGLKHRQQIKEYIGSRLRVKFKGCPWLTDEQITEELFSECIATHLTNDDDKFNLLILMQRRSSLSRKESVPQKTLTIPCFTKYT
ncbi:DNA-directed RNA polymerase I subunit RPA2 [Halotydeus destructor]|nr:DNA-directed RNA polymerase I subunit RPA2 [Halotydeus destructor]